jgi:hypothetical protein
MWNELEHVSVYKTKNKYIPGRNHLAETEEGGGLHYSG